MTSTFDYDLFIIGAGSAGVRCARVSAQLGAKVAVAENRYMGGTCVNVGCVPKKMFVYASEFSHHFDTAEGYGWEPQRPSLNWQTLLQNKDQEIGRLNRVYDSLLENSGVDVIKGAAKILGPHEVVVAGTRYRCERIVVAVGGWPKKGGYPGSELCISSNEIFGLQELPKNVVVEGGGYIAVEFAGIFRGLGCNTELVYRGPLFLRGFEQEIREQLADSMRDRGIQLRFDSSITGVEKTSDGLCVSFSDGQKSNVDAVLSAVGRRPMTDDLGLENTQVSLHDNGTLQVNDHFQTNEPSIFALGDVVGRMALTPVALAEGMALANHLFAGKPIDMNYENIATAVFSQPEIGTVGLTERQAKDRNFEVEVYKSAFKPLKHTISGLAEKSVMKLVVDKNTQKVLGCHMLGEHAGEIMQGLAIAINMGATKADFDKTVGIHPTAAEEWVTMR